MGLTHLKPAGILLCDGVGDVLGVIDLHELDPKLTNVGIDGGLLRPAPAQRHKTCTEVSGEIQS